MGQLAVHEEKRLGENDPRHLRVSRKLDGTPIEVLSDQNGESFHTLLTGIRRQSAFDLDSGTVLRDSHFIVSVKNVLSASLKLKRSPFPGQMWIVIDTNGNAYANNLTITPEGSELINGASSFVLNVNYGWVLITSDGTNYFARKLS